MKHSVIGDQLSVAVKAISGFRFRDTRAIRMSYLNPFLLLGAIGLALPILAHLLNRFEVKRTDWAAMRFLNRSVRVRSRQIKLRDIILLILRCMALLLIVFALARPATKNAEGLLASLGEKRAAVVIALDASFSMQHKEGSSTRFDKAIEKAGTIAEGIRPGDPVTLVLLGAEHRVMLQNAVFDPNEFAEVLDSLEVTAEPLDIDGLPRKLKELAADMKATQKEIYIITDMQEQDWKPRSVWLNESFKDLAAYASVFVVPVGGGSENLAITGLELVSGVLRKGTSARYRATVRNCGSFVAEQVRVNGLINNISVDVKVIPSIAPGTSESVSLCMPFRDPGPVKITAELGEDALEADNAAFTSGQKLYNKSVDFDFMDFESLARAKVVGRELQVSGEAYRVLVLPAMKAVRHSTLEKALEFHRAGGVVLAIDALPEASDRMGLNDPEVATKVKELFPNGTVTDVLTATLAGLPQRDYANLGYDRRRGAAGLVLRGRKPGRALAQSDPVFWPAVHQRCRTALGLVLVAI